MLIFQIFNAKLACAAVYHIPAPALPWLCPLLILIGLALEIASLFFKKYLFLYAGLVLVLCGTIPDRDITLAIGNFLAACGIWIMLKD